MLGLSYHEDLANELVQINRNMRRGAGFEYGADAVDYSVRAFRLANNRLEDRSGFIQVGSCSFQPAQTRICICQNGGNGLIDGRSTPS